MVRKKPKKKNKGKRRGRNKHHSRNHRVKKSFRKSKKFKSKPSGKKPFRKRSNIKLIAILSFSCAVLLSLLHYLFKSVFIIGLSALFWTGFMIAAYLRVIKYINRLNTTDDLTLWGLRIGGTLLIGVGAFFGATFASLGAVFGEPFSLGLGILLIGLIIPGGFAIFRSTRRYPVINVKLI